MSKCLLYFPVLIFAEGNDLKSSLTSSMQALHIIDPIVVCEKVGSTENGQTDANVHIMYEGCREICKEEKKAKTQAF